MEGAMSLENIECCFEADGDDPGNHNMTEEEIVDCEWGGTESPEVEEDGGNSVARLLALEAKRSLDISPSPL